MTFFLPFKSNDLDIAILLVNFVAVGFYCHFSVTEHVSLLMLPYMLSDLIVGIIVPKSIDASLSTLFKGSTRQYTSAFVAHISIVNAVLVAVSIPGIRSPSVFYDSRSVVSSLSNNGF